MTCANGSPPLGLAWENVTVSSDGKAIARGIAVGVGQPQQVIALVPSIGDDNTWLFNAADCVSASNDTCIGQKSGVYNASLSHTFVQATKAAWNGSQQAGEFATDSPIFFYDTLNFGSNGSSAGFPLLLNQPDLGSSSGLGLGPGSTFLDAAVKGGSAPSKAFGLWVGSRSENNPVDGALWIGGYDTARVVGDFTDFPMLNNGLCTTCLVVTNLTYIDNSGASSLFSNSSETLEVALEPFQHGLQLPPDIFANFLKASKGTVGKDPGTQALVTLPTNADLGSLSVTFSNGYSTLIPARELFLPPRQYGPDGSYEISNSTYLVAAMPNTTLAATYVPSWGIPILTMNYLIMDYANQTFSLAPAIQGAYGGSNGPLVQPLCKGLPPVSATAGGPSPTVTAGVATSSTAAASKSHANVGAIAGGVVGGIVGLIIIGLLAFFLLRSRRREKALRQSNDSEIVNTTIVHAPKSDTMSQGYTGSPTEISENGQQGINQWLHSQDKYMNEQPRPTSTATRPQELPAYYQQDKT